MQGDRQLETHSRHHEGNRWWRYQVWVMNGHRMTYDSHQLLVHHVSQNDWKLFCDIFVWKGTCISIGNWVHKWAQKWYTNEPLLAHRFTAFDRVKLCHKLHKTVFMQPFFAWQTMCDTMPTQPILAHHISQKWLKIALCYIWLKGYMCSNR